MDLRKRIELVKAAIERIERGEAAWRELEADASASSESRREALERWLLREGEFGWQWRNVRKLLEAWKEGARYAE